MQRYFNRYWPIILILGILFISHINQVINNQSLMIFHTDSYAQSLQFYLGGWEKLHNLDFSLWDWSSGYGANYLNHVYYFATSPFFFLTLVFNKDMIPYLFLYLNALKLLLIFIFTYLWLSTLVKEKWISSIGALIITFSGWVTFLYHYNLFLDGFVLYPLILLSIEKFYEKKSYLFVLFVGFLGIINYYMLYMFIPFIGIYSIVRYFVLSKEPNIKGLTRNILSILGLGILALGLSSIILLPSINIILNMPRLSESSGIFQTIDIYKIYRYISSLFVPTVKWDNPNYFISVSTDSGYGWGGGISLFSFYLFPLIISRLFSLKDKKMKISIISVYACLFFFSSFTIFYRLFQGTLDVRWFYMFIFMNVYTLVFVLKDMNDYSYSKKSVLFNSITVLLIIFMFYKVTVLKEFSSLDDIVFLQKCLMIASVFILLYTIFLYTKKLNYLIILVSMEAIFSFLLPLYTYPPIEATQFIEQYKSELQSSEGIEFIESIDSGFYRIIRNDLGSYSLNEPFANQYKGVTFYESLYNFNTTEFNNRFTSNWLLPLVYGRTNTNFILSAKYYIQENEVNSVPFGFEYLTTINNDKIYENKYYIPLGYSLESTINSDFFQTLSIYTQDQLWLNYIVTKDSENTKYTSLINREFIADTGTEGYLYLDQTENLRDSLITIENEGTPYLTINKHYGDQVQTEFHDQYYYFQMYIEEGDEFDVFELDVRNEFDDLNTVNIYQTRDLDVYETWYSNLNMIGNVQINHDYISAEITIENETEMVATSIPYDEGWSVYVDGHKIDIEKVNLGFIGFQLGSGQHSLEFKYQSPYFLMGMIISVLSLIMFIILVFRKSNSQKKAIEL